LDHQHDAGVGWFGFFEDSMSDTNANLAPQKAALILGLGETGEAAARWLAGKGRRLVLVDTRSQPPGLAALQERLIANIDSCHVGSELALTWLDDVDMVVLSPGLSPHQEPIKSFLLHAVQLGVEVVGEIELFARALIDLAEQRDYRPQVLGVTGTNGKTTVTALTRHMLVSGGVSCEAAGNIGPAALTALMQALEADTLPQAWVLELSSFQLHTTTSLKLAAGVVLNMTQDHLDWHGDFESYKQDKARLFAQSAICVVNRDDAVVRNMVPTLDDWHIRSFGLAPPVYTHDIGIELNQDVQWLISAEPVDFEQAQAPVSRRRKQVPILPRPAGRPVRLMPVDALPMAGMHNAMNVMAASLLVRSLSIGWAGILNAASHYDGEPHRMRFIRMTRDVHFYDDSKGTNVGATVAGVQGLGRPVVLIAGGQGKGQDFTDLASALVQHGRAAILIGQDAPLLQEAFDRAGVTTLFAADMSQAVALAYEQAQAGDAVVLSPACASFDMFQNYKARGHAFIDAVQELALSVGEVA
jgi:UDP-N-acetylmuramoylalanine--D-glutamate ligase